MTIRVQPYRFSSNPSATIAFLEALGLSREVSTAGDHFAVLRAASGSVAVHAADGSSTGARPGDTHVVFEVDSLDELRQVPGLTTWDEAYGREAGVTDPFGGGIWIGEVQTDLHGYRGHQPAPREGLVVTMVRYSPDFALDSAFFARLGFRPEGPGDQWWQPLRADQASGVVGLHRPTDEPVTTPAADNPVGDNPLCHLGFETSEPLEAVRDRLLAAGLAAEVRDDGGLRALHVVDPDGCQVQVHPSA